MVVAVILAGGTGTRFDGHKPKQFIKVFDKPILAYTVEKFQNNNSIDNIVLVYNHDYLKDTKDVVSKNNFSKVIRYVECGSTYYSSIKNALFEIEDILEDDDIVLFHGACAPLISSEIIEDVIKKAKLHNASASALANSSGVWERTNEEYSKKSIYRSKIIHPQFPYAYKYGFILNVYKKYFFEHNNQRKEGKQKDEHIVFNADFPVYFAKSSKLNFKIDTKEDLELFKAYLLFKKNDK